MALAPFRGRVAGDAVQREYRIVRPDAEVRWLDSRLRLVRDAEGRLLRVDGVAADITARKQHQHKIEYLATRDALTDLPNRRLLVQQIIQIAHAMRCLAIAEGVETQAVADFLREQGCDGAQGWHFSRLLAAQEFSEWMGQAAGSVYSPNAACHPRVSVGSFSTPPLCGGGINRQIWLDLGLYPSPGSVFPKDRPGPERGRPKGLVALRDWAWFAG